MAFDAHRHLNRPGLLLLNGVIYICCASHGDTCPYHGWIIGYDAGTLKQVVAFNTTPDGGMGGIWQGGAAPSVDEAGNIYVITGNGTFDASSGGRNYGNSFLKLTPRLVVADYFTPFNQAELESRDDDLGSSGALLIPSAGSNRKRLLVGAGKEGTIYLLNRENMGRFDRAGDARVVQVLTNAIGPALGTPAYFEDLVYYAGVNDNLKAFALTNGTFLPTPQSQSVVKFPYPGATPTVSANGNQNAILWIAERRSPAVLRAYDARDLARELYNSDQAGERDRCAPGVKFIVPVVANGKVYLGTHNRLEIFGNGLWAAAPEISTPGGIYTNQVSLTMTASDGAEIRYTLDNSAPARDSQLYAGPFELTSTAIVRAKAFRPGHQPSTEASVRFTVFRSDLPAAAAFVAEDATTGGSWLGRYGADGFAIATGAEQLPIYAVLNIQGKDDFVFGELAAEPFALLQTNGVGRTAGAWYTSSEMTLNLAVTDGKTHDVTVYCFDPARNRSQRFVITDAQTGAILSSRDLTDFSSGKYLRWDISGHVKIAITRLSGANALVNGIFFGVVPRVAPPRFEPAAGPFEESLAVRITGPDEGAQIRYTLDGTEPNEFSLLVAGPIEVASSVLIKAKAFNGPLASEIAEAAYDVRQPRPTVVFLNPDIATQGNWRGVYGTSGHMVVGDVVHLPEGVRVNRRNDRLFMASTVSSDSRAPQKAFCSDERLVGVWTSSTSFEIDVNVTRPEGRQVTLYCWDLNQGRRQKIDLIEPWTGALLDSRDLSNFEEGIHLAWEVRGHVRFVIRSQGGSNAVISGLFLDEIGRKPLLTVRTAGDEVLITWPASPAGLWLERTESLSAPFTPWILPTNTSVRWPPANRAEFFRLAPPR